MSKSKKPDLKIVPPSDATPSDVPPGTEGINPQAATQDIPSELARLRLPVLTSPSEVELTHRCHRRHVLGDILRHASYQSPSAIFGTHAHRGAETWWQETIIQGKDHAQSVQVAVDASIDKWKVPDSGYHTKDLMKSVISHYCQNAQLQGSLVGEWELVHLEQRALAVIEFESQEGPDKFALSYQIDRLLQNKNNPLEYASIDLKTASKLSDLWEQGMSQSIQQKLYNILTQEKVFNDHGGEEEVIMHSLVEGIQKKGGIKMQYVWPSLMWTPGLLQEAMNLSIQAAHMDEQAIMLILNEASDLFAAKDPDESKVEDVQKIYNVALRVASCATAFNYMDCRSYYFDCPYTSVCNSDPEDRLAILLDQFEHIGQRF